MMEARFEKMLDQLEDELSGAQEYTKCASATKVDMPELSDMYMRMANQEMEHATHLHNAIDKLVNHFTGHEVSHEIHAIWDWQNERFIRWADKIRTHMEMARKR